MASAMMKAVLFDENKGVVRFKRIAQLFPNVRSFKIRMSGDDQEANVKMMLNDKLVKFLKNEKVRSIQFVGADGKVMESDEFETYKGKCAESGWEMSGYTF